MRLFALASAQRMLLATAIAALLVLASPALTAQDDRFAQDDPPAQAGRLSYVSGAVSMQQVGSDDWGQALINYPIGPGDRIFTSNDGRAEIQVGQSYIRIGPNTDVSFVDDTPHGISIGVAQGSVNVHCFGLWPGQRFYVNTPHGSGGVDSAGEALRVDVLPDDDAAIFTNLGLQAFASGPGYPGVTLRYGQALELVGSNPVYPQWLQPAEFDNLDNWSRQRDRQIANSASYQYVSPEIPGANELDANGTWMPGTEYGAIWFPNNVAADWAPYHYGHWVNHDPWGWVWVEDESWGYAPFHYGRWVSYSGRWGWVPGPPSAHPVWSPAMVAFAGGIRVGGAGVSAWFPLGPGEAYRPWYHASPRYMNEINISNIGESRRVHVRDRYEDNNFGHEEYVNRSRGYSAMRQEDFAAGRSARGANVVVDVHLFDHVQVLDRPDVRANPRPFADHRPDRPVPVEVSRPVFINQSGRLVSSKPGFQPVAPPVKPVPPVRALPGRIVVAPPQGARARDREMNAPTTPSANPTPPQANQPVAPVNGNRPVQTPMPANPPDARGPYNRPTPPPQANQPAPPTPGTRPVPPTPANPPDARGPYNRPTPPPQANQPAPPVPGARPVPPTPANSPAPQVPYNRPTPPPQANQPAPPVPGARPVPPTPANPPDARGPYNRPTPPPAANQPAPPVPGARPVPPTPANPPDVRGPYNRPTPPPAANQPAPPAASKPAPQPPGAKPQPDNRNKEKKDPNKDVPKPNQ